MIVLPLGWTSSAYQVYSDLGDRGSRRGHAPTPRLRPRRLRTAPGRRRAGRDHDIEVPLGWTGNAYRRAGQGGV